MARPVAMDDARGVGEELAEMRERDGVPDTNKSAQRPEEREARSTAEGCRGQPRCQTAAGFMGGSVGGSSR
jgi:hypothetical protein